VLQDGLVSRENVAIGDSHSNQHLAGVPKQSEAIFLGFFFLFRRKTQTLFLLKAINSTRRSSIVSAVHCTNADGWDQVQPAALWMTAEDPDLVQGYWGFRFTGRAQTTQKHHSMFHYRLKTSPRSISLTPVIG
jgi:hypothetical protein